MNALVLIERIVRWVALLGNWPRACLGPAVRMIAEARHEPEAILPAAPPATANVASTAKLLALKLQRPRLSRFVLTTAATATEAARQATAAMTRQAASVPTVRTVRQCWPHQF